MSSTETRDGDTRLGVPGDRLSVDFECRDSFSDPVVETLKSNRDSGDQSSPMDHDRPVAM